VTSAHIFFIPGMILVGMFLGFIVGARAGRNQVDIERKRDEEREVARAARAARRATKVDDRPPAEAKSPEVVSEQKSEGKVADEKPAEKVDEAAAAKDDKPTKKLKGKSR
jgi:hypothetical protein